MKLVFSVPTGYHLRELLLPLKHLLEEDITITSVICLTPAAVFHKELFPTFSSKFEFIENLSSVEKYQHFFEQQKPDLVITDTVGHDERDYPILEGATKARSKTLTFIASWDNVWKIERLLKTPKGVSLADSFIVWNDMMKQHMLQLFPELGANNVKIIGVPRFDYYAGAFKIPTKEQLFEVLGLEDTSRPLIHFSTTELYPMDYVAKHVKEAMDSGQLPKNLALLATVHPGGDLTKHEGLKQYGFTVRYAFGRRESTPVPGFAYNPTEEELYMSVALYKHSSVLVNHSSTTALESLLADVPVINVKYGQPLDWWKWYRSMVYRDFQQHYADVVSDGATSVVKNKQQLTEALRLYVTAPQTNQKERTYTIKKMITAVDGSASRQVFSHLKEKMNHV